MVIVRMYYQLGKLNLLFKYECAHYRYEMSHGLTRNKYCLDFLHVGLNKVNIAVYMYVSVSTFTTTLHMVMFE